MRLFFITVSPKAFILPLPRLYPYQTRDDPCLSGRKIQEFLYTCCGDVSWYDFHGHGTQCGTYRFIGKERVVSYSHKCVGTLEKRIVGTLNPRTFRLVCHRKTQTVFLRLVVICRIYHIILLAFGKHTRTFVYPRLRTLPFLGNTETVYHFRAVERTQILVERSNPDVVAVIHAHESNIRFLFAIKKKRRVNSFLFEHWFSANLFERTVRRFGFRHIKMLVSRKIHNIFLANLVNLGSPEETRYIGVFLFNASPLLVHFFKSFEVKTKMPSDEKFRKHSKYRFHRI